jgi:hypothetical protein
MARLFTDENFPLPAAEELRRLGHIARLVYENRAYLLEAWHEFFH